MNGPARVLIAEDELLIRMGIRLSTDWASLNMTVVDDAASGDAAWEKFQLLRPDVVLLDIRMPGMDGLELIRRIRALDEECVLIVITCMNDFDTLHTAMQYGISDYLLKADMTEESLKRALQNARGKLRGRIPADRTVGALDDGCAVRLERWLTDPAAGDERPIPFLPGWMAVLFDPSGGRMTLQTLQRMLIDQLGGGCATCLVEKDGAVICLFETPPPDLDAFEAKLNRLRDHYRRLFSGRLDAVGGRVMPSPASAYARLCALYDRGYWLNEPCAALAIDEVWLAAKKAGAREHLARHEEFGNGMPLEAQRYIAERARELPVGMIEDWQDGLIDLTMRALNEQLGVGTADVKHLARMVFGCPTAYKAADACIQFMEDNLYRSLERNTRRPEILHAIEYIRRHYAEDLAVSDVAKGVSLSANYFSNLFKRESGMTFTAYLTHHRIERAKGLLRDTDLHAYEIASRCGFSDDAYFSRTFKQVTGMRPITFRQREREVGGREGIPC